jgi:hypothetical protein
LTRRRLATLVLALAIAGARATHGVASSAVGAPQARVVIDATPRAAIHRFVPARAIGGALDGHDAGGTSRILTDANVSAIREAGLGGLTYRLRTELANEAWHWNPAGRWSDPAHRQGYWVSSDTTTAPIIVSWGYRLPRRGDTYDQANRDGWSRLDDGDTMTFWKSDPYLDPRRTGVDADPQWVVADLGGVRALDAARIAWGEPHATRYRIQWWEGPSDGPVMLEPEGRWRDFPAATGWDGAAGTQTLRLSSTPIRTRWVRLLFETGSRTAPPSSMDPRDSLGVAIRELSLGLLDPGGGFRDLVRHAPEAGKQTRMRVSSTDPWHRAADRDTDVEQPGIDLVYRSPLADGQPVMIPVGVLYDTPENAAALVRHLERRGYPLDRVELGEEPDGQDVAPEDYATRYVETARAIHAVDPSLVCGGPSWQDTEDAERAFWPERPHGPHTWIARFLVALDRQHARDTFRFLSFEWYPFDDPCPPFERHIIAAPDLFARSLARLVTEGAPADLPWVVTEYGWSVSSSEAEVGIEAALFDADLIGNALAHGIDRTYFYGIEPGQPARAPHCESWGDLLLWLADDDGRATTRAPAFWGVWLVTHAWCGARDSVHETHPVRVTALAAADSALVPSVYAARRPDGRWGVLLVNRDPRRVWKVDLGVDRGEGAPSPFVGSVRRAIYDRERWRWHAARDEGRPTRAEPPVTDEVPGARSWTLPPYSITVLVGGDRPAR